jgi:hypothetical protein
MKFYIQYREPLRFARFREKFHVRFFRSSSAFPAIACATTTHDILPGGFATLATWNNMIERSFFSG